MPMPIRICWPKSKLSTFNEAARNTIMRVGLECKKRFFSEKMRIDGKRGERWEKRLLGAGKVHMI